MFPNNHVSRPFCDGQILQIAWRRTRALCRIPGGSGSVATSAECRAGVSSLPRGLAEYTNGSPQQSMRTALWGHRSHVSLTLSPGHQPTWESGCAPTWSSRLRLLESRALTMVYLGGKRRMRGSEMRRETAEFATIRGTARVAAGKSDSQMQRTDGWPRQGRGSGP